MNTLYLAHIFILNNQDVGICLCILHTFVGTFVVCKVDTEEKSQKDIVVTASKPSKPLLT